MDALALHRVRIEPTWRATRVGPPPAVTQEGSKRTPLTVVGGTITAAQADQIERHLEQTKGARLNAALAANGATPDAIAFWTEGAR